jgi:ABC-type branched-subunit amino acid transport system ATPase component
VGVLLVEQNLEIAESVAKNCVVLSTGRAVWRGPMSDPAGRAAIHEAYFG